MEIPADADVVERIKNIVAEHEVIFTYDELECPDFLRDGIKNLFFLLVIKRKD